MPHESVAWNGPDCRSLTRSDRKDPAQHGIAFAGKLFIDLPNPAFDKIPRNGCYLIEFYHRCSLEPGAGKGRIIGGNEKI